MLRADSICLAEADIHIATNSAQCLTTLSAQPDRRGGSGLVIPAAGAVLVQDVKLLWRDELTSVHAWLDSGHAPQDPYLLHIAHHCAYRTRGISVTSAISEIWGHCH